jgi:hypothetical protein
MREIRSGSAAGGDLREAHRQALEELRRERQALQELRALLLEFCSENAALHRRNLETLQGLREELERARRQLKAMRVARA